MAGTDHVEVFEGRLRSGIKRYYWRRRAANGEITEQSQAYTLRRSARRAAKRLHPNLTLEER